MAGDFNVDIRKNSQNAYDLISLFGFFGLSPSILDYTRIDGDSKNCIDNIYTNCSICALRLIFEISTSIASVSRVSRRIYCAKNKESFKSILVEQDWEPVYEWPDFCVNQQWESFMGLITPIFNNCFPKKLIRLLCVRELNLRERKFT